MNLCTNAYHAMEEKGGTLTVGLKEVTLSESEMVEYPNFENTQTQFIAIEVSDTGCGMTDAVMERMFDPYFSTKEEGKGTGLGLATVYGIVKSCKGDIRVKSRPGKGTTFTILLPKVNSETRDEDPDSFSASQRACTGERLLIVDDDRDVALMCKEGFESLGYQVDMFFSSLDALAYFKNHHQQIDFVVTDQTMPGKTGFELAREMLAIKADIPIILCSGYTGTISKAKIEATGIKGFVMKPFTVEDLSKKIQHLLNNNKGS
jgi:CheY-like chemotaxis protein